MKKYSVICKLAAAAALCAVLLLPCGCGGKDEPDTILPDAPAVSGSDISASDVSSSDTSGSDVSASDVSASDVSGSDVSSADTGSLSFDDVDVNGPVYTVMLNAEAINARDINAYMATIDPDSEVFETTREDAEYTFAHYRLAVSINDVEIDEMKDDSAVVVVTQTTSAIVLPEKTEPVSGSDVSTSDVSSADVSASDAAPLSGKDLSERFVPCQTVLRHTMTRIGGTWYITSTIPESYTSLASE